MPLNTNQTSTSGSQPGGCEIIWEGLNGTDISYKVLMEICIVEGQKTSMVGLLGAADIGWEPLMYTLHLCLI